MSEGRVFELIQAVDDVNRRLLEALESVPPDRFDRPPAPDEWSVAQVIGHAIESQDFWVGQLERLAREDRPSIGRRTEAERQRRIHGFTYGRPKTPEEARARLSQVAEETRTRLGRLPAEAFGRTAIHPDRGELTGAQVVEYLLVEHLRGHVDQVYATVQQLQPESDRV